jgi:hypothetical protein
MTEVDEVYRDAQTTTGKRRLKGISRMGSRGEDFEESEQSVLAAYADDLSGGSEMMMTMPGLADPGMLQWPLWPTPILKGCCVLCLKGDTKTTYESIRRMSTNRMLLGERLQASLPVVHLRSCANLHIACPTGKCILMAFQRRRTGC